jgi:hypothetical protein
MMPIVYELISSSFLIGKYKTDANGQVFKCLEFNHSRKEVYIQLLNGNKQKMRPMNTDDIALLAKYLKEYKVRAHRRIDTTENVKEFLKELMEDYCVSL